MAHISYSDWQEDFPVDYGPEFDQELEKLLWEFLIRLDQLLPVPNLTQVADAFDFANTQNLIDESSIYL